MFEYEPIFDEEILEKMSSGEITPPEGYKIENGVLFPKSEEEILSDDWNSSIERRCEYRDYLEWKLHKMDVYMSDTDWYVSRKAETGKDIPEDVVATRNEYREKISRFRELQKEIPED